MTPNESRVELLLVVVFEMRKTWVCPQGSA